MTDINLMNNNQKKINLNKSINYISSESKEIIKTNNDKVYKKRNKCFHFECKKKLTLIDLQKKCKCNNYFCIKHFSNLNHSCSHDYKKETKAILEKQNVKCENSKVIKI